MRYFSLFTEIQLNFFVIGNSSIGKSTFIKVILTKFFSNAYQWNNEKFTFYKGTIQTERINMRISFVEYDLKRSEPPNESDYKIIKKEIFKRIEDNEKIRKNSDSFLSEGDDSLVIRFVI